MKEWLAIAGWLVAASALFLFYGQLFHWVRRRHRVAYPYLVLAFIVGLVLAAYGKATPRAGAPGYLVLAVIVVMAAGIVMLIFGVGRGRARINRSSR
jgi:predicted tellurium resistance membrane protein TerC